MVQLIIRLQVYVCYCFTVRFYLYSRGVIRRHCQQCRQLDCIHRENYYQFILGTGKIEGWSRTAGPRD